MADTRSSEIGASMETEAKERATDVVLGYREVDWAAVEAGDIAAVQFLLEACERHEAARVFLQDEAAELGEKLVGGLERFYAESVGPRLRRPAVLQQLDRAATAKQAGPPSMVEAEGLSPRARPQVTVGHTIRMNTGCGHLYVTVNESEDGKPFELFNHMGKAGGCAASQNEAIGRLISYALRCGAQLEPLIKQLKGISCHRPAWGEEGKISSCSDAIGKSLEKYAAASQLRQSAMASAAAHQKGHDGTEVLADANGNGNGRDVLVLEREQITRTQELFVQKSAEPRPARPQEAAVVQGACQDCGGQLSYEEGCVKCHSCGFTECG